MNKELDEALCAKYPLIFKNRHGSPQETLMCFGFEVHDGWYNIIDTLCFLLTSDYRQAKNSYEYIKDRLGEKKYGDKFITQEDIDKAKAKFEEETAKVPFAVQVKEKFGGLRFYVHAATNKHYNYISFAESMSYRTCEECGAPGKTYTDGWHKTLCDIHAEMDGREQEYDDEDE